MTAVTQGCLFNDPDEILEGDGQEFYTLAPTPLTFRSTAPLNELQEVQINGVTVDPSNYTTEEGSTIVTFPIEYLQTLDVDSYEVSVVSNSKSAKGGFTVAAPEVNEYGFYYNQPYTAYVEMFGGNTAVFIRDDGTLDLIVLGGSGYTETCNYTIEDNQLIITSVTGTFTASFSNNGNEGFVNELATTFVVGSESITADGDYIYSYREDLGGYSVTAICKTNAEYGSIKTGINGIDTVAISESAFVDTIVGSNAGNPNITSFSIPEGLTTICSHAFCGCSSLQSITIPHSIETIGELAFAYCGDLTYITFEGTVEQWNAIEKGYIWNANVPATHVQCSDGTVPLN